MHDALRLWLQWNEAQEHLTGRMFRAAKDASQIEALADHVDQIRQRALAATREALR
jgi:hypothetical protein